MNYPYAEWVILFFITYARMPVWIKEQRYQWIKEQQIINGGACLLVFFFLVEMIWNFNV